MINVEDENKKKSIDKLESFTRNYLGIPFVNFEGLDKTVANEIVRSIYLVYSMYPKLYKTLCSIGVCEDIDNQLNMLINSNMNKDIIWKDYVVEEDDCIEFMSNIIYGRHLFNRVPVFSFLSYSSDIREITLDDFNELLSDAKLDHKYTLRHIIFHEFGHILAEVLKLNNDKKLIKIIKEYSNNFKDINKKISNYVEYDLDEDFIIGEAIAESFAFYSLSKNKDELSDLVRIIGEYINFKYKLNINSNRFEISKYYIFSKEKNKVLKKIL